MIFNIVSYRNSKPMPKRLEMPNQHSVTSKRKRSMVFSNKPRKVTTLLISQALCPVSKLEVNGMPGRPRRE